MPKRSKAAPTPPAAAQATYLYCLIRGRRRPTLRLPAGLPGTGPPRLVDAGEGRWLVAADAPLERYGEEPIERGLRDLAWVGECALGHQSVVEACGAAGTVLPMKLFTLFGNDDRAVHHITRTRARIERVLEHVAGCVEWGVRVAFDEARAMRTARERAVQEAAGKRTGTSFLLLKKRQQEAVAALATRARALVDEVYQDLARLARDGRRRPPPAGELGRRILLDGAFLVPTDRGTRFQAVVRGAALRLEPEGYDLTLTGPWPPYNFVAS